MRPRFIYMASLWCVALAFSACRNTPKPLPRTTQRHIPVPSHQKPSTQKSRLELHFEKMGLVNVLALDSTIRMDLHYSSADNFTRTVLYDTLRTIYLPLANARKLIHAQSILRDIDSSLVLIVWDAARPLSIQRLMYSRVAGTPYQSYVARPNKTGFHNYGCAVDLSICHRDGSLLDMGTPFDYFGEKAGIRDEQSFVRRGLLTPEQMSNRKLLRKVMLQAGFRTVAGEWWHFNACSSSQAKQQFALIP